MYLNADVVAGKWKQVSGRIRRSRGQLIHNQLDQILGGLQNHVGLMQQRRGVIVARFERAVKRLQKMPESR
jgi:uncharacterized protein YjbJ (UPF0337 family)